MPFLGSHLAISFRKRRDRRCLLRINCSPAYPHLMDSKTLPSSLHSQIPGSQCPGYSRGCTKQRSLARATTSPPTSWAKGERLRPIHIQSIGLKSFIGKDTTQPSLLLAGHASEISQLRNLLGILHSHQGETTFHQFLKNEKPSRRRSPASVYRQ